MPTVVRVNKVSKKLDALLSEIEVQIDNEGKKHST
jgi:hypothetical protein